MKILRTIMLLGGVIALTHSSFGALRTWNGAGDDDNWSTAANWGGTVPVVGDTLAFAGTQRHTNINDLTLTAAPGLLGASFSSPNWQVDGAALVMNTTFGWTNSAAGSVVWNVPTTLGSSNGTVWVQLPNGSGSLVLSNVISGGNASRHLRKVAGANAAGKLSLMNPNNTFPGNVFLGSGPSEFVKLANAGTPSSLGASANISAASITIGASNTQFDTDSSYIGTEDGETTRVINFQTRGVIRFNNHSPSNGSLTFNGNWTFTPNTNPARLILGGSSTATNRVNGTMVQTTSALPFHLDLAGPGRWVLNNSISLLGDVRIVSGTHALDAAASISSGQIRIFPGAALDVTAFPDGYYLGLFGEQTLTAGHTSGTDADIIGGLYLGAPATLNIGGLGAPATLKLTGGLNALSGTILFDLGDQTTAGEGVNDLIEVGGNLDLRGNVTVIVNPAGGSLVSGTPYTLIKYSGALLDGVANLNVPPPSRAHLATVSADTPNEIRVTFSPSGESAANLVWQGYHYIWDVSTSQAWLNHGTNDVFKQLDTVSFLDHETIFGQNDITLQGVLAPGSITVDSTNNFTLQGSGSISGGSSAMIVKRGSGTFRMLTANVLSSPILISAGTVVGGASGALGNGPITIGDSATGTNDISLLLNNAVNTPNAITVTDNGSGAVTLGREAVGGSVFFSGPVSLSRDLTLFNPGPASSGNRLYVSGVISGQGDITAAGGGYFTLNPATINTFSGDLFIRDVGTLFQVDSGRGLPENCNVDVEEGAALQVFGTMAINSLTGAGVVKGVSGTYTLTVGAANGDSLFTGFITNNNQGGVDGTLNLRKAGTGILTMTGDNSLSRGSTTVAGGILAVNNEFGSGLGYGSVTVDAEGTLAGNGSIILSNNATINGALSVGNADGETGATFTIVSSAALLLNGSLNVDLFSGAGAGDNSANAAAADVLVTDCDVTISGATLNVGNPEDLTGFAAGDKWKIANWSSVPSGTFENMNLPALASGLIWDTSELYTQGIIGVIEGVTPPTIGFSLSGAGLELTWPGGGILQSAPAVTGVYTNVPGATSPFLIPNFDEPEKYYRVLLQP